MTGRSLHIIRRGHCCTHHLCVETVIEKSNNHQHQHSWVLEKALDMVLWNTAGEKEETTLEDARKKSILKIQVLGYHLSIKSRSWVWFLSSEEGNIPCLSVRSSCRCWNNTSTLCYLPCLNLLLHLQLFPVTICGQSHKAWQEPEWPRSRDWRCT